MSDTSIQWTDKTWNPVRGCSVISPGCVNCYAMRQAHRFSGKGKAFEGLTKQTKAGPQWTGAVRLAEKQLLEPLSWRTPQKVFVNSMSDLFHESMQRDWIDRVFAVMALAKHHTFQILTKRADRMREYLSDPDVSKRIAQRMLDEHTRTLIRRREIMPGNGFALGGLRVWPLPNVWLGVSVENQKYADERIPLLLQTPAAVRFISAEPLLGPVDLNGLPDTEGDQSWDASALHGVRECAFGDTVSRESINKLDWVIVGGESGNGARPFEVGWAWSIVKQCREAGVACFVKQLGAVPIVPACRQQHWDWQTIDRPEDKRFSNHAGANSGFWRLNLKDKKGGNSAEWMQGLRVREFPQVTA